jgi:hypothetical protein
MLTLLVLGCGRISTSSRGCACWPAKFTLTLALPASADRAALALSIASLSCNRARAAFTFVNSSVFFQPVLCSLT